MTAEVVSTPEAVDIHKVFVGNLSFEVTNEQLQDTFQSIGDVIRANIISRGTRSLGYGFVEFSSIAAVERAVQEKNGLELCGRPINVEAAKPREPKPKKPRNRRSKAAATGEAAQGAAEAAASSDATPAAASEATSAGKKRRRRGKKTGAKKAAGSEAASSASAPKTPSTTTLFVANLPFTLKEDDAFLKIFVDQGLNPTTARIVKRPPAGKSKGFGFVEFATQEEQLKARDQMHGFKIEDRALNVKVANSEPKESAAASSEAAPAEETPASSE